MNINYYRPETLHQKDNSKIVKLMLQFKVLLAAIILTKLIYVKKAKYVRIVSYQFLLNNTGYVKKFLHLAIKILQGFESVENQNQFLFASISLQIKNFLKELSFIYFQFYLFW